MSKKTLSRRIVKKAVSILAVLCLATAVLAVAQDPIRQDLPASVLRVNTGLVLMSVVATNKDGSRISDLTADDIRILEEGKEQKVAFVTLKRLASDQRAARPAALPAGVHTNRPEYRAPTGPPTIILLDAANTHLENQRRARVELLKFVDEQLESNNQIAVLVLVRSVTILQDFTDDPEPLRAAISKFMGITGISLLVEDTESRAPAEQQADLTSRTFEGRTGTRVTPAIQSSLQVRARAQAFLEQQAEVLLEARIRNTVNAFRLIAQWAAGTPGRKNLIWVSAGMPLAKMTKVINLETGWNGQMRTERSFENEIRRAVSMLSDAQITVYAIDARGLLVDDVLNLEFDAMAREVEGEKIDILRNSFDTKGTLKMVARDTGGQYFINRNDIGNAIAISLADGADYYQIGYYPRNKKLDGKFRKIEIKPRRDGIKLRHRRGYYAIDPAKWNKNKKQKDTPLLMAMVPGAPPASTIMFDVRMVAPEGVTKKTKVPIQFIVNADTLSYKGSEAGPRSYDVEFRVICYKPNGKIAGDAAQVVKATIAPGKIDELLQQGFPFYKMTVELEPGSYIVAAAVRDNLSGHVGSTHFSFGI